jgi:predicted enzyme related to lactoylglutathione lyase
MQLTPLICVHDVEATSCWYQALLGLVSGHGGSDYERLNAGDRLVLQLHKWEVEHHHGPLGDPLHKPYGNGVILWFEIEEFQTAVARAEAMNVDILRPSQLSENGNWEYWLRDPEGYTVVLTSPMP